MEVVCLILGPKLASQPCLLAFWVLTSLHLLSFLLKMFFIILVIFMLSNDRKLSLKLLIHVREEFQKH